MIYHFDDFQLKYLCDVIEAERRVRERLYNELKWTNAWSPAGMTKVHKGRLGRGQKETVKKRPSSARRHRDKLDSETSADESSSLKVRPSSARESREKGNEDRRRKPRSLAFEIGSESKSVAVKWGTDPRTLSVAMGDGYGRKPRTSRRQELGHDKFMISNFGKGSSFQIDTGKTEQDPTNIIVDNVRRGKSGPKETLLVTGGGTNVVIHNPKPEGAPKGNETIHVCSGESNVIVKKPAIEEGSDSSQNETERKEKKRSKKKSKTEKQKESIDKYTNIKFSKNTGTQTAWMDTVPDPPPGSDNAYRRIKFMGEDKTHREYKTAVIDDHQYVKPMTDHDIPLVVEVVQPDEDDFEDESCEDPDSRPEVIHYIDKSVPARAIEVFEPVYVQPHPIWEPIKYDHSDSRPRSGNRTKSRPPLPPRQYRPLDVYDRRRADTNDRYLVVKSRAPPLKPPRAPIDYKQQDDVIFTVY